MLEWATMTNLIRSALVSLGYKAIASGVRLPRSKLVADFDQWSHLINLIRRLDINVFLDVGANRGFFSKHLRMSGYSGCLISFEPIPEDQERIRAFAANDPSWTVCGYALGSASGCKDFQITLSGDQTTLSSFLPLKWQALKWQAEGARTVPVDVRRLDEVLPELIKGIESPRIFLKMDTQGFDNQVFEGASACLDRIMGIQSEISVIPIYEGMPHYTQSLERYERFGFELTNLFVVSRAPDGRVVEYDCVMARPGALTQPDSRGPPSLAFD
jgi:FkbM family methyltransferase